MEETGVSPEKERSIESSLPPKDKFFGRGGIYVTEKGRLRSVSRNYKEADFILMKVFKQVELFTVAVTGSVS